MFSSILSVALPICEMSDTEPKLIVKSIDYLCASWKANAFSDVCPW